MFVFRKSAVSCIGLLRELSQDLRYAVRIYRSRALVTVLALTALTLGIGATTGVFSVVNALLLRSLPFGNAERLVALANFYWIEFGLHNRSAFHQWEHQSTWWEDVTAYRSVNMSLSQGGQAVRLKVAETTSGFFTTLGTQLHIGRPFAVEEDVAGKDDVAVIGYSLWQQLFGGDPRALGSAFRLNGVLTTVIGVARPDFDYPGETLVWTSTYFDSDRLPKSDGFFGNAIGRLKRGISLGQASAISQAELRRAFPKDMTGDPQRLPHLISLQNQLAGPARQASLVLLTVVAFVLLVAYANVGQLLLSRIIERRHELAMRAALGASRMRLAKQLITESVVLTLTAAAAGLAVAHWASRLAASAQPATLSTQQYSILDWRVLGFAVATAIITGFLFGVFPAFIAGRLQPTADSVRHYAVDDFGAPRMRAALVVAQTAFAIVLVAGSFTMGRGFLKLLGTDLGFSTNKAATLTVSLFGSGYDTDQRAEQYYRTSLDRLRAIPGVESVGAVDSLPLSRQQSIPGVRPKLDSGQTLESATPVSITTGYFHSIGASMIAGRDFTDADREGAEPVAIVNEQVVRTAKTGSTLIGRKMTLGDPRRSVTIVGVVRDTRLSLTSPAFAQIFLPVNQQPTNFVTFVARGRGSPESYLPVLRAALQDVDRQVPIYDVKTYDQRLQEILAKPRFYATATLFFGGLALLLAVISTYGVASRSIAQRTHEIGVRIAVGASPHYLRRTLLLQSMVPVVAGMLIGMAGAVGLGRFLQFLIASAEPISFRICLSAASLLTTTTAAAIWTATGRIVRTDPTTMLRVG